MWQRRLKLGTYFGIPVYVHWTFSLLVAYVGYFGSQAGILGTVYSLLLLCAMFFCVTLHEYGHSLTARRFGIETLDITLFPIGGVARLMKIPRVPWQELVVAVAGPAVNVVIFCVLLLGLVATHFFKVPVLQGPLDDHSVLYWVYLGLNYFDVLSFVFLLMAVNAALVLFNMIPAFPMDGGRVLRALLAMVTEYRSATRIASGVGLCCALIMGAVGLYYVHPTASLVAIFIAYAGLSEARHVNEIEPIRDLKVSSVMIENPTAVYSDLVFGDLLAVLRECPLPRYRSLIVTTR